MPCSFSAFISVRPFHPTIAPELTPMLSNDARILRGAASAAVPVGVVAVLVSALVAGEKGLIGGLVGVAVVAVFFGGGFAALMRLTRDRPQVLMLAGMLIYTVQILLVGVFIIVFRNTTLFNPRAFALTLLVTALAWVGGQVVYTMRTKMLYVEPQPQVSAKERKEQQAKPESRDGT
jgi:ATP synthase protein I